MASASKTLTIAVEFEMKISVSFLIPVVATFLLLLADVQLLSLLETCNTIFTSVPAADCWDMVEQDDCPTESFCGDNKCFWAFRKRTRPDASSAWSEWSEWSFTTENYQAAIVEDDENPDLEHQYNHPHYPACFHTDGYKKITAPTYFSCTDGQESGKTTIQPAPPALPKHTCGKVQDCSGTGCSLQATGFWVCVAGVETTGIPITVEYENCAGTACPSE